MDRNMRKVMTLTLAIFGLMLLSPSVDAQISQKISYQGLLTDPSGNSVNGQIAIVFSLYNVASGGTALWTEVHNVTVSNGFYNVILGESNLIPTPITLPFDQPYYLGIRVGSDAEMTPRKELTSVAYALRAKTVETIGSHSHSGADITTGTVSEARIDSAIARDAEVATAVNAHASRTDNPHATTAAQVGAALASHNHDSTYVNEGQAGSITSGMIVDGSVAKSKLSAAGGTSGQVLGTDGTNLVWQAPSFPGMPGIEFLSIGAGYNVPTTITNYGSIVITAPTAGYVLVQVSGLAVTFGQNTVVVVGIGDSTSAFDFTTQVGVLDGVDTLRREFSLNVTGVYSVAAGSKTIYLLAQKPSVFSAQTVNLDSLFISAVFFPNRY